MQLFENDLNYMRLALKLAKKAASLNEIPVGAVLVLNNQIISEGYNQTLTLNDPTAHAEIIALKKAAEKMNNYRLPGATLYVTLEPCLMCSGAIFQARLARIVFGAFEPKTGVCGSCLNVFDMPMLNHHTTYQSGILAEESAAVLHSFFKRLRQLKKNVH